MINENIASRKAHAETALNSMGLSGALAQEYTREVSRQAAALAGELTQSAANQAIYDITNNVPTGIIDAIDADRAEEVVLRAMASAAATFVKWDILAARDLAMAILTEVNDHALAAKLATVAAELDAAENA